MCIRDRISGNSSTVCVHTTSNPHGFFLILRNKQALMYVKAPTIISGEIVHVRRLRNQKQIDPFLYHSLLSLADTFGEFLFRKNRHFFSSLTNWSLISSKSHKASKTLFDDSCIDIVDCLLYTSDAADEEDSVDLGGRRLIKKK